MLLYPVEATPVTNSATGTTAAITATLPAVANRVNYITGLQVTGTGATAAGGPAVTVTGTVGGSLNYVFSQTTIAANAQSPLLVFFEPAIPATGTNVAISATTTLGAGTTAGAVTLTGYVL